MIVLCYEESHVASLRPMRTLKQCSRNFGRHAMTKLLEEAFAKARELPEDERDSDAIMLLSMTRDDLQIEPIDDETRAAIVEGLID